MGNLGFWEIIALGILALVVFGPERLPEVARNVARMIAKFRREANSTLADLRSSADLEDLRDLREEWRATSAELKPQALLAGPMASPLRPTDDAPSTVSADLPPPYDRDAT
jgi:sec-independent protein translocase protein TatB